jgi:very-short-patch-repair endonuclease
MSPDALLRDVARRQHGVFTLGQVLECGFTRPVVRRRLERRVWEEVLGRVYRVAASRPVDWRQRQIALVLATGGVSAGLAAAALHDLAASPRRPEILLGRAPRRDLGAVVHTTCALAPIDCTEVDGISVTTVARTLVDLAGRCPRGAFEDMLDTAIVRRLVTVDRLRDRAEALWAPRRSGCAVVLELLKARHAADARAANRWEARVLRTVRQLGLPEPRLNHRVRVGGRVRYLDLAWPDAKVAVEFDGFVPHSTRRVFDDDRARQNDLVADRWTVFRVTATMLRDAERTFAPIATAVRARNVAA